MWRSSRYLHNFARQNAVLGLERSCGAGNRSQISYSTILNKTNRFAPLSALLRSQLKPFTRHTPNTKTPSSRTIFHDTPSRGALPHSDGRQVSSISLYLPLHDADHRARTKLKLCNCGEGRRGYSSATSVEENHNKNEVLDAGGFSFRLKKDFVEKYRDKVCLLGICETHYITSYEWCVGREEHLDSTPPRTLLPLGLHSFSYHILLTLCLDDTLL